MMRSSFRRIACETGGGTGSPVAARSTQMSQSTAPGDARPSPAAAGEEGHRGACGGPAPGGSDGSRHAVDADGLPAPPASAGVNWPRPQPRSSALPSGRERPPYSSRSGAGAARMAVRSDGDIGGRIIEPMSSSFAALSAGVHSSAARGHVRRTTILAPGRPAGPYGGRRRRRRPPCPSRCRAALAHSRCTASRRARWRPRGS